jgi:hypothetical protein
MLRKTMIALFAVASLAILSPADASARGGFGGGGFHGGGFHRGFGGGGWRGGGWRGPAFGALGLGVGLGCRGGEPPRWLTSQRDLMLKPPSFSRAFFRPGKR